MSNHSKPRTSASLANWSPWTGVKRKKKHETTNKVQAAAAAALLLLLPPPRTVLTCEKEISCWAQKSVTSSNEWDPILSKFYRIKETWWLVLESDQVRASLTHHSWLPPANAIDQQSSFVPDRKKLFSLLDRSVSLAFVGGKCEAGSNWPSLVGRSSENKFNGAIFHRVKHASHIKIFQFDLSSSINLCLDPFWSLTGAMF